MPEIRRSTVLIVFKLSDEVTHIFIASIEGDFCDWSIAFQKKGSSLIDTVFIQVCQRRFANLLFKKFTEIIFVHMCAAGQLF